MIFHYQVYNVCVSWSVPLKFMKMAKPFKFLQISLIRFVLFMSRNIYSGDIYKCVITHIILETIKFVLLNWYAKSASDFVLWRVVVIHDVCMRFLIPGDDAVDLHLFWHKCPSDSPYRYTPILPLSRLKEVCGKSEIGRVQVSALPSSK